MLGYFADIWEKRHLTNVFHWCDPAVPCACCAFSGLAMRSDEMPPLVQCCSAVGEFFLSAFCWLSYDISAWKARWHLFQGDITALWFSCCSSTSFWVLLNFRAHYKHMVLVQHLFEFVGHWLIRFSISGNSAKRSCTATETDFSLLPFKICRQSLHELGQTEILISCAGSTRQCEPASTAMACCSGKARTRSATGEKKL